MMTSIPLTDMEGTISKHITLASMQILTKYRIPLKMRLLIIPKWFPDKPSKLTRAQQNSAESRSPIWDFALGQLYVKEITFNEAAKAAPCLEFWSTTFKNPLKNRIDNLTGW